jgi:hypothetical protein
MRIVSLFLTVLAILAVPTTGSIARAEDKPNVVLIVMDNLGWG